MTYAEWIFSGGAVHTMDPVRPLAEAVAVAGGRIVAVGPDALDWRGPGTEVVDLAGRALFPGFQDAHVHPLAAGLQLLSCDLSTTHSLKDYFGLIVDFAHRHPQHEWITGAGWYGDVFDGGFPNRELLDELVADRPVFLMSHDAHSAWVNTEALRRAGITAETADPEGGRIVRDGAGRASGMLLESAADLVSSLIPVPTDEHLRSALLCAQDTLHSFGITAWQDAAVGQALGTPDPFEHYLALEGDGLLTAAVTGALWWQIDEGLGQIQSLLDRRTRAAARFRTTAVKIMLDGVCENFTASLTRPYRGHPGQRGMSMIPVDELRRVAAVLDEKGFDLHLHAVGDQAVRDALTALDLPSRPDWQPRHQIAHLDLIDRLDIERFARLGAIANIQPLWARQDPVLVETKLPYLDEMHQQLHFAFKTFDRAGIPLAMGSDWPVSSPNPLWGAHTAVNRTAPRTDPHAADARSQGSPLLPGEAISLNTALMAYTRGSALANRQDAERGSVGLGRAADLVVLDTDPYAVEAADLGEIKVDLTLAGGKPVYRREANGT